MKIQFLGTGAAEGVPAMFCACPVCKKIRSMGKQEVRTRSQTVKFLLISRRRHITTALSTASIFPR